jgi:hypothetical protein
MKNAKIIKEIKKTKIEDIIEQEIYNIDEYYY